MTMYLYDNMLAVTSRKLCRGDFLEQVEWLAGRHPAGIILREKDLSEAEYECLAEKVLRICEKTETRCILHFWPEAARRLGCRRIHLPLWKLRERAGEREEFREVGVSVHSLEEAAEACALGADYLTVGHIFSTECKKGTPGRGLAFLHQICCSVPVPVYGIGGITPERVQSILDQGAEGYCVMSGIMQKL